jgi:hypothetical protein
MDGVGLGFGAGEEAFESLVGEDGSGGEDVLYYGLRVGHENLMINEGAVCFRAGKGLWGKGRKGGKRILRQRLSFQGKAQG